METPRSPLAGAAFTNALQTIILLAMRLTSPKKWRHTRNADIGITFSKNSAGPQTSLAKGHSGKLSWNFIMSMLFSLLLCKEQNNINNDTNRRVLSICNSQSQVQCQCLILHTHLTYTYYECCPSFSDCIEQSSPYQNLNEGKYTIGNLSNSFYKFYLE